MFAKVSRRRRYTVGNDQTHTGGRRTDTRRETQSVKLGCTVREGHRTLQIFLGGPPSGVVSAKVAGDRLGLGSRSETWRCSFG